jgi:predicted AAA+ superfamily ATPase
MVFGVIERIETALVLKRLRERTVVAILGARQVGKTTLARQVAQRWKGQVHTFDLERVVDQRRLADAELTLGPLRGLVVLDEVQHLPGLFAALRVLADRPRRPARFLVLGSASPELLKQSAESLAGRISYVDLSGLVVAESGPAAWPKLWLRGGFPASFLARSEQVSRQWRADFIRTFVTRDLPELGIRVAPATLTRFWSMLAHVHAQVLNWSELGRSMGVDDHVVRRYVDILAQTFMVRPLPPWFENISKRQVKSPKLLLRDSGVLHTLLDVPDERTLQGHPRLGASFEGFVIEQLLSTLRVEPGQAFFWRTHDGAELDLLVVRGKHRLGFEVKHTSAPSVTPSMRIALHDLKLDKLLVIHPGKERWPMAERIEAIPITALANVDFPQLAAAPDRQT